MPQLHQAVLQVGRDSGTGIRRHAVPRLDARVADIAGMTDDQREPRPRAEGAAILTEPPSF